MFNIDNQSQKFCMHLQVERMLMKQSSMQQVHKRLQAAPLQPNLPVHRIDHGRHIGLLRLEAYLDEWTNCNDT